MFGAKIKNLSISIDCWVLVENSRRVFEIESYHDCQPNVSSSIFTPRLPLSLPPIIGVKNLSSWDVWLWLIDLSPVDLRQTHFEPCRHELELDWTLNRWANIDSGKHSHREQLAALRAASTSRNYALYRATLRLFAWKISTHDAFDGRPHKQKPDPIETTIATRLRYGDEIESKQLAHLSVEQVEQDSTSPRCCRRLFIASKARAECSVSGWVHS